MKLNKSSITTIIWIVVVLFFSCGSMFEDFFSSIGQQNQVVELDTAMETNQYNTYVKVNEDGSYLVKEVIDVAFTYAKHGIYRYVPYQGVSQFVDDKGKENKIPYYADIELIDSNIDVAVSTENGSKVFRFGSEHETTTGETYEFSYKVSPRFDDANYTNAYYNVFPISWQNKIPAGSKFEISFPKGYDQEQFHMYYGGYGEAIEADQILEVQYGENKITGTLQQELELGQGITFFEKMENNYFSNIPTTNGNKMMLLVITGVLLAVVLALFVLCGRDAKIYPSVQFYPPEGLDSASVGYIVDGTVDNEDIISLIVYWADKGYIRIQEDGEEKLTLFMKEGLPKDAPKHQKTVFKGIFGRISPKEEGETKRKIKDLKYKFASAMEKARGEIKDDVQELANGSIYTGTSVVARGICTILTVIPFGAFILITSWLSYTSTGIWILNGVCFIGFLISVFLLNRSIDRWYSTAKQERKTYLIGKIGFSFILFALFTGVYLVRVRNKEIFNFKWILFFVLAATVIMMVCTAFMKKRTEQCIEWMGRLIGLRDFIETAELDRLKAMAEENPDWFYHILPYAYVFGLSDVFMKKFAEISIPAPQWYTNTYHQPDVFDMMYFNHCMNRNMAYMSSTMSIPEPPKNTGGGSSGGGFSGGGGGGFSGGGFGGGGGGSW